MAVAPSSTPARFPGRCAGGEVPSCPGPPSLTVLRPGLSPSSSATLGRSTRCPLRETTLGPSTASGLGAEDRRRPPVAWRACLGFGLRGGCGVGTASSFSSARGVLVPKSLPDRSSRWEILKEADYVRNHITALPVVMVIELFTPKKLM